MNDVIYSTDSDEHLVNIGEKSEPQWCEQTEEDLMNDLQDMYDSWDMLYGD